MKTLIARHKKACEHIGICPESVLPIRWLSKAALAFDRNSTRKVLIEDVNQAESIWRLYRNATCRLSRICFDHCR
ncbi:hypothetical protein ACLB1E_18035 [Escherichia coli]